MNPQASTLSPITDRPVTLLVNVRSRRGAALFEQAKQGLRAGPGFKDIQAIAVEDPARLSEIAHRTAEPGRLVVIGGGDGSVALGAAGLAYTPATMGILPLGTGNTLARSLGIPINLQGALDVLAHGREAVIDLAQANERIFASALTIGLSAAVAVQLKDEAKRQLGLFTYLTIVPRALLTARPFLARIRTPSESFTVETYQFMVVNGRRIAAYLPASPETSLTDGVLTGFCLGEVSRWQLFTTTLMLELGRVRYLPESHYFSSPEVFIETDPIQDVDLDGDVCLRTPCAVKVLSRALNIIVPASLQTL